MSGTAIKQPGAEWRTGLYLRWTARGILIAIAAFWLWFGIADGWHDAKSLGPMGLLMMLPAALLTLGVLYVAWRWELTGAWLLLALTALGTFMFAQNMRHGEKSPGVVLGLAAVFILPFLTPALLLLAKCLLERRRRMHAV